MPVLQLAENNTQMCERERKIGKPVATVDKGQPGKNSAGKMASSSDCWVAVGRRRKCLSCNGGWWVDTMTPGKSERLGFIVSI